jgi:hypothetical protein
MKTYLVKTAMVAAITCASVSANAAISLAQAVGATGVSTYVGGLGLQLVENFDGVSNGMMISPAADFGVYSASLLNNYSKPLNTTGNFLSVPQGGVSIPPARFATYQLNTPANILGFYLGSPDAQNSIQFKLNGVALGAAVTIGSLIGANATSQNADSRYITLNAGGSFNQVVFGTGKIAMEVDNITSAVPEPGEWAMMIAGLGVVSLIARRRKANV